MTSIYTQETMLFHTTFYVTNRSAECGLHNSNFDNLDWYDSAQKALVLLLPHILLLSLIRRLKLLNPWFYEHGLELGLVRCKM